MPPTLKKKKNLWLRKNNTVTEQIIKCKIKGLRSDGLKNFLERKKPWKHKSWWWIYTSQNFGLRVQDFRGKTKQRSLTLGHDQLQDQGGGFSWSTWHWRLQQDRHLHCKNESSSKNPRMATPWWPWSENPAPGYAKAVQWMLWSPPKERMSKWESWLAWLRWNLHAGESGNTRELLWQMGWKVV